MFLQFIYIVLIILAFVYLYQYSQTRGIYNIKTGKGINGLSIFLNLKIPFINTPLPKFFQSQTYFTDPIYYLFVGPLVKVNVRDHKLASIVMSDTETYAKGATIFKQSKLFNRFVGTDNVLFTNGEEWSRQRRSINPAFFQLEKFVTPFQEKAKLLLEKVDGNKDGVVDDVVDYMQRLTLDILGKTIFDFEFNSIDGSIQKVIHAYDYLMKEGISIKAFVFGNSYDKFLPNSEFIVKFNESLSVLEDFMKDLIQKSKKKIQDSPMNTWSLMEYLVQANIAEDESKMSDEELRQNLIVFFLAGHDTTSVSLSYGILLISQYKEVQEKMRKEIQSVLQEHGGITYEAMNKLEYTLCVIKEVMRMYPPVPSLPDKYTTKDTVLGDVFIPENTNVTIDIQEIHYSKDVYGDPENFRPERWTKEEQLKHKIPKSAWIPFSAGSRVCVGNNFSLLEQKIFYSEMLMKYDLIGLENKEIEFDKVIGVASPKAQKIHFKKFN